MNPTATVPPDRFARHETAWALLILAVYLVVNLSVATITPTVSADEAAYTDAAASMALGQGFTSTLWGQPRQEFWCGNVPLYQIILLGTFKVFGFGFFQARAVNSFLAAFGTLMVWGGVRRAKMVRTTGWRLAGMLLILSGSTTTITFRTIRPDATMFLACAVVFFLACWPRQMWQRCLLAGLAALLLPWAGLPMIPYSALLAGVALVVLGWTWFWLFASVGVGIIGGVGLLVLFYNRFASFKLFVDIVLPFTGLNHVPAGHSSLFVKVWGESPGADNLFTSFFGNPLSTIDPRTLGDYSAMALFALFLLVVMAGAWGQMDRSLKRKTLFVLALMLCIPPAMHLAGHYRSMYKWMTYVPLTVAVGWAAETAGRLGTLSRLRFLPSAVISLAVFLGIPFRTITALPQWHQRSPRPAEAVAAHYVRPDDVIVCDRKFWFFVKSHARLVYLYNLPARGDFSRTADLPTNEVSLLGITPGSMEVVTGKLGTNWVKVPDAAIPGMAELRQTRYAVDFYRRPGRE